MVDITNPTEVHQSNIMRPDLNEIEADEQKALLEEMERIEWEAEEHKKAAQAKFLSHFSKDRQGKIKKDMEVTFDPLQPKVPSNVSNSQHDRFQEFDAKFTRHDNDIHNLVQGQRGITDRLDALLIHSDVNHRSSHVTDPNARNKEVVDPIENQPQQPLYGMPTNFYPGQPDYRAVSTGTSAPKAIVTNAIVTTPEVVEPLSFVPPG